MIKEAVQIQISNGLETRPIAMLVQVASQYKSEIHLESGNKCVNAKSIMGMMTLGLDNGENVTVTANGPDEQQAMDSIRQYLTQESR
ncbi:MAG: HPr family phosphocarrier protein [Eubacterium sp.]|nr:HPr family phosphocarrier protein [Eubacterium sp.]